MRSFLPLLAALALGGAACARSPIHGEVPPSARPRFVVRVWVEEDTAMPQHLFLEGCRVWAPLGIACVPVRYSAAADVRFESVRTPCPPAPPGSKVTPILARAFSDTHVEMYVNCYLDEDGELDAHKMRMVAAHEFGHELGIWKHVPEECGDKTMTYQRRSDGSNLCGTALMNPTYDTDIDELTDVDGHAFALRRKNFSILRTSVEHTAISEDASPTLCTYH